MSTVVLKLSQNLSRFLFQLLSTVPLPSETVRHYTLCTVHCLRHLKYETEVFGKNTWELAATVAMCLTNQNWHVIRNISKSQTDKRFGALNHVLVRKNTVTILWHRQESGGADTNVIINAVVIY